MVQKLEREQTLAGCFWLICCFSIFLQAKHIEILEKCVECYILCGFAKHSDNFSR